MINETTVTDFVVAGFAITMLFAPSVLIIIWGIIEITDRKLKHRRNKNEKILDEILERLKQ